MIIPIGEKIIVEPRSSEMTPGGIYTPRGDGTAFDYGEVVMVGEGVKEGLIRNGDTLIYFKETSVPLGKCAVVNLKHVIAVERVDA